MAGVVAGVEHEVAVVAVVAIVVEHHQRGAVDVLVGAARQPGQAL
jgi:hypothetical protein